MKRGHGSQQALRFRRIVRRRFRDAQCERNGGWYRITWGSLVLGAAPTPHEAWKVVRDKIRAEKFADALIG